MGLLTDILKEIPQAAVLKEKIAAIEAKYAAADTENAILKDDLRKANAEIAKLKKQVEDLTHKDDLDETEIDLLHRVAQTDYDNATAQIIGQRLNISPVRLDYHFARLEESGYIEGGLIDDFGLHYGLTQKGRALLIAKNLV